MTMKDKVMIEFKTKYDKRIISKACKISISQILIPLIIIAIGFFCLSIVSFVQNNIISGIIWLVFAFCYIPFTYFIVLISQISKYDRLYLKENNKENQVIDTYVFQNKNIKISTDLGDKNLSRMETDYDFFVKVVETKEDFILFKRKSAIFVLPKSSITQGTLQEFEELMSKKYSENFRQR